jgi:DNA-binding NarL/FixJ family response regulator
MSGNSTRLLIVDDHEVVRVGLRLLLERRAGLEVVGEADSMASAVDVASKCSPDVVIMDIRLPDGSGVEACREIRARRPQTKVIMLTSYADEDAVLAAILAGASGYLLKQIGSQALVDAIQTVARGRSLLDPSVTEKGPRAGEEDGHQRGGRTALELSAQEQRILALIAEGKTNKEIAAAVCLSDKTVKNYVSSILSKLNLSRRSAAAAFVAGQRRRSEPSSHS